MVIKSVDMNYVKTLSNKLVAIESTEVGLSPCNINFPVGPGITHAAKK
jgi:hypothetical protein